jgi:hypothetical protein
LLIAPPAINKDMMLQGIAACIEKIMNIGAASLLEAML